MDSGLKSANSTPGKLAVDLLPVLPAHGTGQIKGPRHLQEPAIGKAGSKWPGSHELLEASTAQCTESGRSDLAKIAGLGGSSLRLRLRVDGCSHQHAVSGASDMGGMTPTLQAPKSNTSRRGSK